MAESGVRIVETLDRELWKGRVEIDTSAPFKSVKQAVLQFEGTASGQSPRKIPSPPESPCIDLVAIKEQAENLEKELVRKERETLDVLKELEATKMIAEELRIKIKEKTSEKSQWKESATARKSQSIWNQKRIETQSEGSTKNIEGESRNSILEELKQAKFNLSRASDGLIHIKSSVESLRRQIETERAAMDETRDRIQKNSIKISDLEKELHQISEISEVNRYKKMTEAGESEILRLTAEIDKLKAGIRAAELRFPLEEANSELKVRRKALVEALAAVEMSREAKLAAEAALRRRRRRLHPTLSIGQILSEKLHGTSDVMTSLRSESEPQTSLGDVISSAVVAAGGKTSFTLPTLSTILTVNRRKKKAQSYQ